jgi:hypothetical protein
MSLSINQSKIDEQLRNPPESAYVVFPCNLDTPPISVPDTPPSVSGTVDVSSELDQYRDRVLSLRQRIIARGERPANSPEELERIIDETRGRL